MTPKQQARLAERDTKVAQLAIDPLKTVGQIADELLVHEQTIYRSLRRLGLNRAVGRPTKVR